VSRHGHVSNLGSHSMDSIDDIWDAPVEPSSPRRSTPAPADSDNESLPRTRPSASRRPLFLDSDDEDELHQAPAPATAIAPNVDAIFAQALDDENFESRPMPPPLDVNAIQRQAEQRHALTLPTILPGNTPSSNAEVTKGNEPNALEADEKKRKKPAVLNEARLLDTTHGFPRLIEMMKGFEPKGKGHEVR
jgi:replication fork protection complex subunit Csm3/Swi3